MDAGALDVLHDAGNEDVRAVRNHVHLQLLAHQILVHQNRVFHLPREDDVHIGPHVLVVVGNDHVLPADDVAGPEQDGVAQLVCRRQGLLHAQDPPALGALDVEALQKRVEPLPVLRHVDGLGGGAQNGDALLVQELGELNGGLPAEGHHHPHGLFHLNNVHHVLGVQGLEIEAVGGVVVGRDGFRVVVDNHHVVAQLFQRPDAVDGGVIELNALADADGAGAQDQDHRAAGPGEGPGLAELVKTGVKIGGLRVELRAAGVHHLVNGLPGLLREPVRPGETEQGLVRVAQALALGVTLRRQSVPLQGLLEVRKAPQLPEKPAVDLCNGEDLLHADAGFHSLEDGEEPPVVHPAEPLPNGGALRVLPVEGVHPDFRPPDGLHQCHLKAGGDGHDLAGGLHLGAQGAGGVGEFVEGPFRHFNDDIVQGGLETGAGLAGDVVFDFVQGVPQGDFRRDFGNGIAGGLGGQGGGPGDPGVYFNDGVFKAVRVQGQLDVAAAHDAKMRDDVQRGGAEHLKLPVRQGLGGGHHDGVPGVDPHGVQVLHGAHGNDVARGVPHSLKLDFLPAEDGPFNQHLGDGRGVQARLGDNPELRLVPCRAAPRAAQGEGGADNDGIAGFRGCFQGLLHSLRDAGGNDRLVDFHHSGLEQLPVLRPGDGGGIGSQKPDVLLLEEALFAELHGQGQAGLAPQARQEGVGLFLADNALEGFGGEGL